MSRTVHTPISDLRHIRHLMERSRYFIGLSGLSGVGAGCFALLGIAAVVAYQWAGGSDLVFITEDVRLNAPHPWGISPLMFLLTNAAVVVSGALACGYFFTRRRVIRLGYTIQDPKTYKLVVNICVPLAVGGIFCLALVYHAQGGLIGPTTLVFYGLALLNGSNFATEELRTLGYMELALGLLSLFFVGYGLYFWALGFGVFHIAYGIWMYLKYDAA
ncbi:hypothetical protein GGR28_000775 [Lewinella aquimaris]|uniref:Uncharacterized protein n=1 Tax=Neolewinella aquimaris TaxID=1835722 RepID=A0A840DY65_9BACT|nr:hypothetical protein [Neolewinella aquimaris]MBB4078174.1 hypothetical protein [Neolewinella aquimaris]